MAPPLSSEAELRSVIPDTAFKRGKELLLANKLRDVEFQGDSIDKATAICGGSNPGDSYDVSIIVDPNASEKPIYTCNCPAGKGKMCKHSVALLLLRAKELNKGASNSGSGNDGEEDYLKMDEEEVEDAVEWVSNPEKIVPNPHARRVLPKWMTEAPPEKVKKGRASKKQKVEEQDGEEKPAKKAPAKRKSKAADGTEARKTTSRRNKTQTQRDGDKTTRSRGRNKRPNDDGEQGAVARLLDNNRRKMQRQTTEESTSTTSEGDDGDFDGMDLTTDDLLSMAQEHLESPEAEPAAAAAEAAEPERPVDRRPMESPPVKKRKDDSIFSTSSWKVGISETALNRDNGASSRREILAPTAAAAAAAAAAPAGITTADSIANDMFDLMFGPALAEAAAPVLPTLISRDRVPQLTKPLEERTSMGDDGRNIADIPVQRPFVELNSCGNLSTSNNTNINTTINTNINTNSGIQPKTKKKSSLKDQIGSLLL